MFSAILIRLVSSRNRDGEKGGSNLRLILIEVVHDFLDVHLHPPVSLHLNFCLAYPAARRAISPNQKFHRWPVRYSWPMGASGERMASAWQGLGFDDAFNKTFERVKRLIHGFRERFPESDSD